MDLRYADDTGKEWRVTFQCRDGQITTTEGGRVGLGYVLMAALPETESFLLVRKARKEGYEYSDLWAFPGGMFRGSEPEVSDLERSIRVALVDRVREETGVEFGEGTLAMSSYPLVTSYTAKGIKRHTLVLPFRTDASLCSRILPSPCDSSISTATWRSPIGLWPLIAPANCLFAGRLLWPAMTEGERKVALPHLQAALRQCNVAAEEVRLHRTEAWWLGTVQ